LNSSSTLSIAHNPSVWFRPPKDHVLLTAFAPEPRHEASISPTDYSERRIATSGIFGRTRAAYRERLKDLTSANPNYYRRFSILADAYAESFLRVCEEMDDSSLALRLAEAAADLHGLAGLLSRREKLYRAPSRAAKVSAFAEMLRVNAYFVSKYRKLSSKSSFKDLLFTLR
jgi:hypothetical protein